MFHSVVSVLVDDKLRLSLGAWVATKAGLVIYSGMYGGWTPWHTHHGTCMLNADAGMLIDTKTSDVTRGGG